MINFKKDKLKGTNPLKHSAVVAKYFYYYFTYGKVYFAAER